jgi:hypothetical protein
MQSFKTRFLSVLMAGGMALCAGAAAAAPNPFEGLQLNGNAYIGTRGWLKLITQREQASSAYTTTPYALDATFSFTSTFRVYSTVKKSGPQADGFAFVMQNDPSGDKALGYDGNCLAVCNIQNYAAIAFQSYVNDTAGLWLNGSTDTQPFNLGSKNDYVDVTVTYNQMDTTLAFTAVNKNTGQTVSGSYTVDLTTLGPSVYIGFTGASGGAQSVEHVQRWSFTYTP